MHDLLAVKDGIVAKGFPELALMDLSLKYEDLDDAYFEFDRIRKGRYHIDVDITLHKAPLGVLEGGMAHELAHISEDCKRGGLAHRADMILYSIFPAYETRDERKADMLAVKRGYGAQLLEFLKYANQRREDFTVEDGLTVEELERLLPKDR